MGILLKEHISTKLIITKEVNLWERDRNNYILHLLEEKLEITPRNFKSERGKDYPCFTCKVSENEVTLNSDYFVGIDWLTKDQYIHIEPKLNFIVAEIYEKVIEEWKEDVSHKEIEDFNQSAKEKIKQTNKESFKEVDVIAMLMKIMSHSEVAKETENLLLIDWKAPEINIHQKQDLLTPFLVVQFLNLLQDISRKGLKKSYYKVHENLRNRVKGKILVGQQIKQNLFKNRFTNTVCEYQVFGEDNLENRFLKKVFQFCTQYIENNEYYFKEKEDNKNGILWMVNYIRPTFEHIGSEIDIQEIKHFKYNPFFKEYKEAIKIGQQILRRFAYNITKTTEQEVPTPPFWIDMPKMFELYVYAKLLEDNPNLNAKNFNFQFSTHGNSLDFLICSEDKKIVVDTKYKLKYNYGKIHEDIRQVAGYARLKKVRQKTFVSDDNAELNCLIIYPKPIHKLHDTNLKVEGLLNTEIEAYHKVFKLGIPLPIINSD